MAAKKSVGWTKWNANWRAQNASGRLRRTVLKALTGTSPGLDHAAIAIAVAPAMGGLADDSIRCECGEGFPGSEWNHRLRSTEQHLEAAGLIRHDTSTGRWMLDRSGAGRRYGIDWNRDELLQALGLYWTQKVQRTETGREVRALAKALGRTPDSVVMKLANFESIDPKVTKRALPHGNSLDGVVFRAYSNRHGVLRDEIERIRMGRAEDDDEGGSVAHASRAIAAGKWRVEDNVAPAKVRRGQAAFSRAVKAAYRHTCAFCGIRVRALLVASHIKPWADDLNNRLNPSNGLCLCAIHDRAFDKGLVSLSNDGKLLISRALLSRSKEPEVMGFIKPLNGRRVIFPRALTPPRSFLTYHRKAIYLG